MQFGTQPFFLQAPQGRVLGVSVSSPVTGAWTRFVRSEFFTRWLLNAVFDTITLFFIAACVIFLETSSRLVNGLGRKDLNLLQKMRLVPRMLKHAPAESFAKYACRLENGTYMCSFEEHKRLHTLSKKALGGITVLGVLLITFVVLVGALLQVGS